MIRTKRPRRFHAPMLLAAASVLGGCATGTALLEGGDVPGVAPGVQSWCANIWYSLLVIEILFPPPDADGAP